jgi:hypothetical protein
MPSRRRSLALLLGCLALFAVGFSLLERLVTPPTPLAEAVDKESSDALEPIVPEVRRLGVDGVVIDAGELRRTTIVIDGGPEKVDLLVACLEAGVEQAFGEGGSFVPPGATGWLTRGAQRRAYEKYVRDEVDRITDECNH